MPITSEPQKPLRQSVVTSLFCVFFVLKHTDCHALCTFQVDVIDVMAAGLLSKQYLLFKSVCFLLGSTCSSSSHWVTHLQPLLLAGTGPAAVGRSIPEAGSGLLQPAWCCVALRRLRVVLDASDSSGS